MNCRQVPLFLQALLLFSLLYILFFSPVLFGDRIFSSDGSGAAFFKPLELWTNSMFSGYPYAAAGEKQTFYPLRALFLLLFPDGPNFNLFIISAYVMASSFTAAYVYSLLQSRLAAVVSGLIFGMSGFMMSHLMHGGIIHAACWLPLMIWAADRLHRGFSGRWFVIGAISVAMSLLAGHPQITLYELMATALLVLFFFNRASQGSLTYLFACLMFIVAGFLLAAIQILPQTELILHSARAAISFGDFMTFSLPVKQIAQLFFPFLFTSHPYTDAMGYFGQYNNLIELTGYAGILPLMLATLGVVSFRTRQHVKLLLSLIVISLVYALGGDYFITRIMYHIPVLDMVRAHARAFVIMTFSISILAGYGCHAWQQGRLSAKLINRTIWGWLTLFLLLLTLINVMYGQMEKIATFKGAPVVDFIVNPSLLVPVGLFVASVLLLYRFRKKSASSGAIGALLLVTIVADLSSQAWYDEWRIFSPGADILNPEPYIVKYQALLSVSHQRVAAFGGFSSSAFAPAEAERFNVPNITGQGYSVAGYGSISGVTEVGRITPEMLEVNNRGLDLLAVRYVLPAATYRAEYKEDGIVWAAEKFNPMLADKGFMSDRMSHKKYNINFNPPVKADRVYLASSVMHSKGRGQEVARLLFHDIDNHTVEKKMIAGRDTGDWTQVLSAVDRPATYGSSPGISAARQAFITSMNLGDGTYKSVDIEWIGPELAALLPQGITFEDSATATQTAVSLSRLLFGQSRWRQVDTVRGLPVYENLNAMPRAWLVPEVISVSDDAALHAIHTSVLPDGRSFDPSRMALLEEGAGIANKLSTTDADIHIESLDSTEIQIRVKSPADTFLVMSDIDYPGWQVSVDGVTAKIYRTDSILRGVIVPAGRHLVRCEFHPNSFYVGAVVTVVTLLVLLCMFALTFSRLGRELPHFFCGGRYINAK